MELILNSPCSFVNRLAQILALESQDSYLFGLYLTQIAQYSNLSESQVESLVGLLKQEYPGAFWTVGANNPLHKIDLAQTVSDLFS